MTQASPTALAPSPEQIRAQAAVARLKRYREARDRARARRLAAHPYLAELLNRVAPCLAARRESSPLDMETLRRHW